MVSLGKVVTSTGDTITIPKKPISVDAPPSDGEVAYVGNIITPNLSKIQNNSTQKDKVIAALKDVPEMTPLVAKITNSQLLDECMMNCP